MSTERRAVLMWWFNNLCKEQMLDRDDPGSVVGLTWHDLKTMDSELQAVDEGGFFHDRLDEFLSGETSVLDPEDAGPLAKAIMKHVVYPLLSGLARS